VSYLQRCIDYAQRIGLKPLADSWLPPFEPGILRHWPTGYGMHLPVNETLPVPKAVEALNVHLGWAIKALDAA
jgi:hypothetical protein